MRRTGAEPPNLVGARLHLARPRQGRGRFRWRAVADADDQVDTVLIASAFDSRPWRAGRVRQRLTPTTRGRSPDRSRPCSAPVLDRPTL